MNLSILHSDTLAKHNVVSFDTLLDAAVTE